VKRLIVGLATLIAMQGAAMAQMTEHPRYAVIDTLVKSLITKVRLAQAAYFTANQAYFQGIITPAAPQDGLVDATPNWAVAPTDQVASWKDFDPSTFKTNFKIPFQIAILVYSGSEGWGWLLMIDVWKSGLGPDERGHIGSHWYYQHYEGPEELNPLGFDRWLVRQN
jgi:hypothetical protein